MSTCIFPSKRDGLASHRAVSLAQKQKDKSCNNIPKKKRPYDTMDAAKAKGSPRPDLVFTWWHLSPRYVAVESPGTCWRTVCGAGCRSFSAPPAPAGLPVLGAMRPLRTPNSCAPPLGGLVSRTEFCSTVHSPGHAGMKFSALPSSIWPTARQHRRQRAFPRAATMAAVVAERQ